MDLILNFLMSFWELTVSVGIYVIIGLVFVGIVHIYISDEWIQKHLGEKSRFPALKGALYGIPLPLCSCGVIPLATSLKKKGASKGAVTSFFITTPMTGVDSIIATYGVFGWAMALLRVVSSFISGVVAGSLAGKDQEVPKKPIFSQFAPQKEETCGCSGGCCSSEKKEEESAFKKAYDYAVFEVFKDISKPLFYGLFLGAFFTVLLPSNAFSYLPDSFFVRYLFILVISLPIYVCSISAIPIAITLLSLGASYGEAFIFLAAAPATNFITAGVVKEILGSKTLVIYILSIVVTTLVFASGIDFLLPKELFYFSSGEFAEKSSMLKNITAVVFLGYILYFFTNVLKKRKN